VPHGTPSAVFDVTLTSFTKAKEKWQMNNAEKVGGWCNLCGGGGGHVWGEMSRRIMWCAGEWEWAC
jgi:hypothetical protein